MDTKQYPIDILSINDEIKDNDLFKGLNVSNLDIDKLKFNIIKLKTGEILFRQGDTANSIFLIIEGEISLIHKQSFGKINLSLSRNNFFGHVELFLKTDRNSIAIALKDSCVIELSKEIIESFLSKDTSFLNNVKDSFFNLDSASINQFENVITEWSGSTIKPANVIPMELISTVDEKISHIANNQIPIISYANLPVDETIKLNKIKSVTNKTNTKSDCEVINPKETTEDVNLTVNDLISTIADLKFQLSTAIGKLILSSQKVKAQSRLVELKGKEKLNLEKKLQDLSTTLKEKNNEINVLNNCITQLKNKLSDVNKLKEEIKSPKTNYKADTDEYNELKKENSFLSEQIKTLKLQVEATKNEGSKPLIVNEELNKLESELEKYKRINHEKDKIIKEQKEHIENIGLVNSGALKAIASVKNSCFEKLKIKDNEITELKDKLSNIQYTLDEKVFIENQQIETIEKQAQKIAELELLANQFKENTNNQTILNEENVLTVGSSDVSSDEQSQSNEINETFSKCKLIKISPVDASLTDGTFEHFQESDVHIINVNLTRATMDVVTVFNEFLDGIISREKNKIVVSLLDCEFIDSSILGALVKNLKKATSLGGDLRLVGFHPAVRSMMELTRMLRLFEYFPSLEAAIRSFK